MNARMLIGLFLLSAFLLSGCARMQSRQDADTAWAVFSSVQSELSEDADIAMLYQNVSPGLRKRANAYPDRDAALRDLLYAALVMPVVTGYQEKPAGRGRCLLVNGYSELDRPVLASIRFVARDGRLLWDDAFVILHDPSGDFPGRALCPEELRAWEIAHYPDTVQVLEEIEKLERLDAHP